jgi:predicted adenine nucleotide alpha hydrolase (AANH) superfamily ATPase
MKLKDRILLHVCCAPCSTAVIERLQEQGYDIKLFFSNSNIHPAEEFNKRIDEACKIALMLNLDLIEDAYDHDAWLAHISGLEDEPERGKRCLKCFAYSLGKTCIMAQKIGIPGFTTTLTVSRHKSSRDIFSIGSTLPGFLAMDFKKQDGYTRSIVLTKQFELYRQGYCGCEFSKRRAI